MELVETKIVPNTGWLLAEMVIESSKQGSIVVPQSNTLSSLVKMRVVTKAEIDIESTETICIGDVVLIKKEDLLEYSQNGKKYYMLEAQFCVAKVFGE